MLASAAQAIRKHLTAKAPLAIVLGSGFQPVTESLRIRKRIRYRQLPGFPQTTVPGHSGSVLIGTFQEVETIVLSGRAHFYEGYSLEQVTFPIRVLQAAGARALLLTNAAGGIHPRYRPGDFMRLTDHINLMGLNPLRSTAATDRSAPAFVDLTEVYDCALGALLDQAATTTRVRLHSGVYAAVSGPSYETPAEIRAFRRLGADAVGMSTVPEAIVARSLGLRVAALSCITNLAAGRSPGPISHAEVLERGRAVGVRAMNLLGEFVRLYGQN